MRVFEGSFIEIHDAGSTPSGKTRRFNVFAKTNIATPLGIIQWYPAWRKYCVAPAYPTVYEETCIREIALFLETRTREHKQRDRTL